ncbi:hypothetical protein QZH41_016941 [Actinostola sp. cb2023]|nr:hypothetical protein QZH41_016941 [Actinostola sp. cb2023]
MLHKAEEVKAEVFQTIYEDYSFGEFQDLNSTTCDLNWKVDRLLNDINSTSKKIRGSVYTQLDVAATEHSHLTQDLCETEAIAKVLTQLCKVHGLLDAFPSEMRDEEYFKAAQIIDTVNEELSRLPKAGQESKIYIALRTHLTLNTVKYESFIFIAEFENTGEKSQDIWEEACTVFLQTFDCVSKEVIVSLLKDSTRTKVIDPGKVYVKILEILDQIKSQFHSNNEEKSDKNKNGSENEEKPVQLFSLLGSFVWPVLSEDIVKECLAKSIPNTSAQLEKYQEVITNTLEFEDKLKSLGFIKESPSSLTKYVKDISIHFGNKKCQDLLVTARDLMKDDIHNTIVIDQFSDTATLCSLGELQKAVNGKQPSQNIEASTENGLSPHTFQLPKCRISESTKKLMNLAYGTLLEATKSPSQSAIQLFYTVRNMFELFCNVVPTYHQESLATLPQLAALHHNNCMYISHLLLTIGHQFKSHLPEPLNQGAATFVDLVPTIRGLGEKCLLEQLRRQRSQLLDIVKNADGFADAHEDDRRRKIDRSVKQVLHQLLHLRKIWLGVLPENLFDQSLGALLDAVLEDITDQVLHLEDISSEEANCLHSILSILANRGPEILQDTENNQSETDRSTELSTYVPHWSKYTQTIGALEASLQDLADGWGEGKGTLTTDFTANEIRGLIRALFQNTDRRAAVLAKIKAT